MAVLQVVAVILMFCTSQLPEALVSSSIQVIKLVHHEAYLPESCLAERCLAKSCLAKSCLAKSCLELSSQEDKFNLKDLVPLLTDGELVFSGEPPSLKKHFKDYKKTQASQLVASFHFFVKWSLEEVEDGD